MWRSTLFALLTVAAYGQNLPHGQIIDEVKCAADASQAYALYLPSNYSPMRHWPVILAFDPRARGRAPVVQYQAAAEKYGYIVAGSNNSRNGPYQPSLVAAQAMLNDVTSRFSYDDKRVYLAGLSGGARLAMDMAMGTGHFAGVIASSAGFPHEPHKTLAFPVFATAGTEDFNYIEMRNFDRVLTSPHRVEVFNGPHTWLPPELATEAVEWLEIQAMKSGRRNRDEALLTRLFDARKAKLAGTDANAYLALTALAADFEGLRDVTEFSKRAAALAQQKSVKDALQKQRSQEDHEEQINRELADLQEEVSEQITDVEHRKVIFDQLRARLTTLSHQSAATEDSEDRRMARRVISGIMADGRGRNDPEFQKLLNEIQPPRRP